MGSSSIPARLDALPWSRWHWRVVVALGTAWLLDGLEVTLVGSLGAVLERPDTLGLSVAQVGWSGSCYVLGAVLGALAFGRAADRLGRKRLFIITLAVYLAATLATSLSQGFDSFALFRLITGFGIGGEYSAINSAIDELIPARVRGRVDLAVNGSFWIGAALGAAASLVLLDENLVDPRWGWRAAFGLGAVLGVAIIAVRRHVPESPRWLASRGRGAEAEQVMQHIEAQAAPQGGAQQAARTAHGAHEGLARKPLPWKAIMNVVFVRLRRRSLLGLSLMAAQAFFYNAMFFTYALVLVRYYGVPDARVGSYIFPFAVANFLGPLVLGGLFDSVGRRAMISATYGFSGLALFLSAYGFEQAWFSAAGQAAAWAVVFFGASAAESSAYLTVSEIFPLEMRAVAISLFYAAGTTIGGVLGPVLFASLIGAADRSALFFGYCLAAAAMCAAAAVARFAGVDAERKPLESIAQPVIAA